MIRILRWGRRLLGAALLAWAAWQLWRPFVVGPQGRPLEGVDPVTGERYGVRLTPLTPAETAAARDREWAVMAGVDSPAHP